MGQTESFTYLLITFTTIAYFISIKTILISKSESNIDFWHYNIRLLNEFSKIHSHFDIGCNKFKQPRFFTAVHYEVRRDLVIGSVYMVICFVLAIVLAIENEFAWRSSNSTESYFDVWKMFVNHTQNFVWTVNFSTLFLVAVFLGFFIKLYCACLQLISEGLKEIITRQKFGSSQIFEAYQPNECFIRSERKNIEIETAILLDRCFKAYYIIEEIVREFGRHFNSEMFLIFTFSFFVIFARAFFVILYILKSSPTSFLYMIFKIIVHIWKIFYITTLCSKLNGEVQNISFFLHRIDLEPMPPHLQAKVNMLSTKLSSDPLTISPGQFFKLNRGLITTVITIF
ncbi:unnamed protein product, partial [Allacma fusca]